MFRTLRTVSALVCIDKRNISAYKAGCLWKFKLSEVDDWIRSGGATDDNGKDDE